jgi:hypothetical protein
MPSKVTAQYGLKYNVLNLNQETFCTANIQMINLKA